jgi:hypothetical protein
MSPIFFLAVQYNFDTFRHLSQFLALSMLSVKLIFWDVAKVYFFCVVA